MKYASNSLIPFVILLCGWTGERIWWNGCRLRKTCIFSILGFALCHLCFSEMHFYVSINILSSGWCATWPPVQWNMGWRQSFIAFEGSFSLHWRALKSGLLRSVRRTCALLCLEGEVAKARGRVYWGMGWVIKSRMRSFRGANLSHARFFRIAWPIFTTDQLVHACCTDECRQLSHLPTHYSFPVLQMLSESHASSHTLFQLLLASQRTQVASSVVAWNAKTIQFYTRGLKTGRLLSNESIAT